MLVEMSPSATDRKMLSSLGGTEFYELERRLSHKQPTVSSLLSKVLALETITFKISKRGFTVKPLEGVTMTASGQSRSLGELMRITTTDNNVVLVYGMYKGSQLYECFVKISGDHTNSYKCERERFRMKLTVKLKCLMDTEETVVVGVSAGSSAIARRVLWGQGEEKAHVAVEDDGLTLENILLGSGGVFRRASELARGRRIFDNCNLNRLIVEYDGQDNGSRLKEVIKRKRASKKKTDESESEAEEKRNEL